MYQAKSLNICPDSKSQKTKSGCLTPSFSTSKADLWQTTPVHPSIRGIKIPSRENLTAGTQKMKVQVSRFFFWSFQTSVMFRFQGFCYGPMKPPPVAVGSTPLTVKVSLTLRPGERFGQPVTPSDSWGFFGFNSRNTLCSGNAPKGFSEVSP